MKKISLIRKERDDIVQRLSNPHNIHGKDIAVLAARKAELDHILEIADRLDTLQHTADDLRRIINEESDADVIALAKQELPNTEQGVLQTTQDLRRALLPRNPHADRDVVVEIRAGAGGDEASLFARDLFAMYTKYAELRGWTVRIVSESRSEVSGYKEIIFSLSGTGAYGAYKFERGVHRIQRIPETEKSGRIHTSTASVAILPKAEPIDIEIRPEDITIDTFRAGGHGGQKVQKTDSAVRITHIPTGTVAQCQNERSQQQNKEHALAVLRARILAEQIEKHHRKTSADRRIQIGSGDRSEKIRTYNIPQDRITDHRIKQTWHGIERIFEGELDDIIEALQHEEERRLLEANA